ncbi:hypothetical protein BsWGS_17900 [Bradybaena similaris]
MAAESHFVINADPLMKNILSTIKPDIGQLNKAKTIQSRNGSENGDVKHLIPSDNSQKEWEPDVKYLVSSHLWLQNHGLKKQRLTLNQILPSIGFRFNEKLDEGLKKPVSSRYGRQLFSQLMRPDGQTFNISCSRDKLYHLEKKLLQAIYFFKRRIEWLTTESRRIFGVIEEKSVTIVLNFCNVTTQQFNQYMTALESVLRQQVSHISRFNLIRACEEMQLFSSESVSVSHDTIESAVRWIWSLDPLAAVSQTSTVEAVLRALNDKYSGAVYLFTEGTSVNNGKELLKHKVNEALCTQNSIPVHVVSFNCDCPDTIKFLREFAESTNGRFHAYAVVMDLDAYETQSGDGTANQAHIMKRKTLGGVPSGAGVRKDVILIFEEMEEARSTLEQLHLLREKLPTFSVPVKAEETDPGQESTVNKEHYVTSAVWLKSHGLDAKGLRWHEIVSNLAFRHTDTVVDLMHSSTAETNADAIVQQKLVNARYCDELFPVVKLKDGQVFHVLVTPDIYRSYEEKIHAVLHRIHQRIDWLKAGSRALFGTLVEEQIYILIDTSASMENSLEFVKQKIFVLMQEQLRYKKKFNIIAFNSKAVAWKDKIVDVSEHSLRAAWTWVQSLTCSGSTNTHAAIDMAICDPQVEAIYLLTDGRPDQPPSSIICQVKMRKMITVHTISFNCNDTEANTFLYNLAKITGGRYHHFSQNGHAVNHPQAWESMDVKNLRDEISRGLELLSELSRLRDESSRLTWKKGTADLRQNIKTFREAEESVSIKTSEISTVTEIRQHSRVHSLSPRRSSAALSNLPKKTLSSYSGQPITDPEYMPKHGRGQLVKRQNPVSVSYSGFNRGRHYHTRTSSGRFTPNEWMLPESKALFKRQREKHRTSSVIANQNSEKGKPLSTKQWLAKYGLAAKHLTIIDALGSTFVSHKAKYVSVLDKYISGKVFNEIMPLAFVSGDQKMYFFNPHGINLKEYENRVRAAVDKFKKRLHVIVWEALPPSSKAQYDSDGPVSLTNNVQKMLQLLREADWPVSEKDVYLLLDEITKGEKYINQSKILRKAAVIEDSDIKKESRASNSSLESLHRSRSKGSVSSQYSSQRSGENSPRRLRSRSLSSDSDNFNVASRRQKISSSKSASRSHSSSSSKSRRSQRSQSKSPRQTSLPAQVNSPRRSASKPSSKSSPKSLTLHGGNTVRTVASASVSSDEKNVKKESKGASNFSGGRHSKKINATASSVGKSYNKQSVSSSKGDKLKTTEQPLPAKEEIKAVEDMPNVVARRNSQKYKKHVRMKITISHTKKSQNASRKMRGKIHVILKLMTGQKVIAKMDKDGLYYPAEVVRCPDPQHYMVRFVCDGRGVLTRHVLPQGGAVSCPPLYVGDYALIKVIRQDTMCECFAPAEIIAVPPKHAEDKLYTVVMYSGQKARTTRRYLIKISKQQFYADCKDISQHQNEIRDESHEAVARQSSESSPRKRPDDRKKHTRPITLPGGNDGSTPVRSRSTSPETSTVAEDTNSIADRADLQEDSVRERSSSRDRSSSSLRESKEFVSPTRSTLQSSSEEDEHEEDMHKSGLHKEASNPHRMSSEENSDTMERQVKTLKKRSRSSKKKKEKRAKEKTKHNDKKVTIPKPDGDDVASGEKDTHLSWLLEQRTSLQKHSPLAKGEHVLARWTDDGLYCEGIVTHYFGNCSYEIKDSCGYTERIWREDILQKHKEPNKVLEINHHVIAVHPEQKSSYVPGVIESIHGNIIQVKCYDNQVISVDQQEVYHISYQKYKLDVDYIKKKENDRVHSVAIARCDEAGTYLSGTVIEKHRDSQQYTIQWADGSRSAQQTIHMFGAFSHLPQPCLHSYVLACSDPVELKFLPGTVTKCVEGTYSVKFYDGTRQGSIHQNQCFWLEETYYNEAVKFCKQHKPTHRL